ncbi:MAG: hypothetical protein IKP35_00575 [Alphaproteobacteria bacterium]|nr:hypothetical protein [Alphaproteobacteria bacterium]
MNKRFFITSMSIIMGLCLAFNDCANAAPRTAVRGSATARKSVANTKQSVPETTAEPITAEPEQPTVETAPIILNKSNQFEAAVTSVLESATSENSFAEQIRKQRAAREASVARDEATSAQQNALKSGSNKCDKDLRECMMDKCGKDFTECATDGDTIFGDKLNSCKRNTTCSGEEFSLFTAEIKADRDLNVQLASYETVVECGNQYNACIVNECGKTFDKCLGKSAADSAIQKCAIIANDCKAADSGLASRFGTAVGKLRGSAETNIKKDEERLYKLRDLMSKQCKTLGAAFDERSFDCVYTVNFFAGENQNKPTASRKVYAGDSFTCMQEWFGINATTFKENAFRETRSQTAASSAMLGAGLGTAAGLVTSGAIGRALDTQKAKKDYKQECEGLGDGYKFKGGKCIDENTGKEIDLDIDDDQPKQQQAEGVTPTPQNNKEEKPEKKEETSPTPLNAEEESLGPGPEDRPITETLEEPEELEDETPIDKYAAENYEPTEECGVIGRKECNQNKRTYKICEIEGEGSRDCNHKNMLPSNATAAKCDAKSTRDKTINGKKYKICIATACNDKTTLSVDHCVPKKK